MRRKFNKKGEVFGVGKDTALIGSSLSVEEREILLLKNRMK
jgi:hypothetical protein